MKKPLLVLATALLATSFSFNASANSRGHEQSEHQHNRQQVKVVKNAIKQNNKQHKNRKVVIVRKTHKQVVQKKPSSSFSISFGNGINTSIVIAQNNAHQVKHDNGHQHKVIKVIK